MADRAGGRRLTHADRIIAMRKLSEIGGVRSLEMLLPMALALNGEPYHLRDHYPFSPMFDTDMPANILWKTGRQVSKCWPLFGDNRVTLADGRQAPASELRVGDEVVSFDRFRATTSRIIDKMDVGDKDTLRVTTRLGSVIDIAVSHPLRTVSGWVRGSELRVGDRVAAARRGGRFGRGRLTDRVLLTAYMIGDGCCGLSKNWNFTAVPGGALIEFMRLASLQERQGVHVVRKADNAAVSVQLHADNEIRRWMRQDGLVGCGSATKFIPDWVFRLNRQATAAFVARLWATDGWVTIAKNGTPAIGYCTISSRLAWGLRALLTKFGIPASVKRRPGAYRDDETGLIVECNDAFIVRVETRDGWRAFMDSFDVPDKPPVQLPETAENNNRDTIPLGVRELIADIAGSIRWKKTDSMCSAGLRLRPKYALTYTTAKCYLTHFERCCPEHPRLVELRELIDGDVIWDEVTSIEPRGRQSCWDIEVETTHNYVLNGLLSHNSTSLAAHGVILSNCIPNFKTLYVTPLYEQIRRFSNNYVRPFIDRSPIKSLWSGTSTENSVLQRSFKNLSLMIFSFALLDADRVRGVSADRVGIDEIQDIDQDHIPIIKETMSHSKWGLSQYTGTPKSNDNLIEFLWQRSSQAEWFVPCYQQGCRTWNIPSMEYHLADMLGPWSEWISDRQPGLVCHKCRKPIDPRPPHGRWVHKYGSRKRQFAGFHVPQVILPLHCCQPNKWAELLYKQQTAPPNVFWNEVMGESVDVGQKLITETELKAACTLGHDNDPLGGPGPAVTSMLRHYRMRVLAVDWGGGGEDGVSFTTLALLGLTPDGRIHVLWGRRLHTPNDHLLEARQVIHYMHRCRADLLVHDYTGAGIVRETVLVQAGYPLDRVMPVQYVRAATRNLIRFIPPSPLHSRAHYSLDKTRSLLYTFLAIKTGLLHFFRWDKVDQDRPGLISDFLALVEEKTSSRLAGDIYTIIRNPLFTDDFAQAVNIGCAAIWHANDCWPDFAQAAGIGRVSHAQVMAAGSWQHGWENDPQMAGYFQQP